MSKQCGHKMLTDFHRDWRDTFQRDLTKIL